MVIKLVVFWKLLNFQKNLTCTKESEDITNKKEEMKWNLVKCKIWICEIIMPNKTFNRHSKTFNRHNLENGSIRRPRSGMKVKNKL